MTGIMIAMVGQSVGEVSMNKNESEIQALITLLQLPIDKNAKANLLQNYIATYGPVPDGYGEQIKNLLGEVG